MSKLGKFQQQTSLALNNPAQESPDTVIGRDADGISRRFNIYRNNRAGSLIDALHGTYPVLYQLLGDAFFRAAARQFIDEIPPKSPVLSEYGEGFGTFVQGLPGTAKFPYLADVAKLEWLRLQSYHAANERVLDLGALQSIDPSKLVEYKLKPHCAMAVVKSEWAVGSLWQHGQSSENKQIDIAQAETVLITRPDLDVQLQLLEADGALFLQQLGLNLTIAEAATQCLRDNPEFDTGTHLQGLMAMGAFSAIFL